MRIVPDHDIPVLAALQIVLIVSVVDVPHVARDPYALHADRQFRWREPRIQQRTDQIPLALLLARVHMRPEFVAYLQLVLPAGIQP